MTISLLLLPISAAAFEQGTQYFTIQSGTGFYVNRDYVITNAHVVSGCTKVLLGNGNIQEQDSDVVVVDKERDLALIRSVSAPYEFAPLRTDIDSLTAGDEVMVIGYPGDKGIHGQYTVAKAQVQKFDLLGGSPWQIYITDVVEHGNSGGPVLDAAGNVIGVVVGRMQLTTRNTMTNETLSQQRVGVAISLNALRRFLEDHGIFIQWASSGMLTLDTDMVENNAKGYIVNVQCRQDAAPPVASPEEER